MSDSPLEYHVGVYQGHAIAHCPQTGHTATVPLREVASAMRRRDALPVPLTHDLLTDLDTVSGQYVGDDFIASGEIVGDDVEVGAGRVRKKLKKALKKGVKGVAKAAKKVVKSRLGRAILASTGAGVASSALKKGLHVAHAKKVKKQAKKNPAKRKAQALGKAQARKTGKSSLATSKKLAKKHGVETRDVHSTAVSETVTQAANQGDSDAQSAIATVEDVDTAQEVPMSEESEDDDESGEEESGDEEYDQTDEYQA